MIFEEDLRSFLLTVDALTAIVGQQIYGIIRPQGLRPLPEILIARALTTRQEKFCGTDPLVSADFAFDIYAIGLSQATALTRTLRQLFRGFSGVMGSTPVGPIFLVNEFPISGSDPDPGVIRVQMTFTIWYQED